MKRELDPAACRRFWLPDYPFMKAEIYLVNHQLSREHNENMRKRDKRLSLRVRADDLYDLVTRGHGYRKQLSYPSLVTYVVKVMRPRVIKVNCILKMMMFVAYQMRKQTIHRHNRMVMFVDATNYGIHPDRTIKNRRSLNNASVVTWRPCYGTLAFEIDVMELSFKRLGGTLKDAFDFEEQVKLALSALREIPEGNTTECDVK